MLSLEAVPSIIIDLFKRLTEQLSTPSSPFTALSTLATQAEQDIPLILYVLTKSPRFINFNTKKSYLQQCREQFFKKTLFFSFYMVKYLDNN